MRRDHAIEAAHFWTVVVERTGSSRFDMEKAREQLRQARRVLYQMTRSMSQTQWTLLGRSRCAAPAHVAVCYLY
jgi:hypothetical protein